MFESLNNLRQPEPTRTSAVFVMISIFLLGVLIGMQIMSWKFRHWHWQTWDPFEIFENLLTLIALCVIVWRPILAIFKKLTDSRNPVSTDAL